MPKKILVPHETETAMIRMYRCGGMSCRDIGKKTNYDYRVVSRVLKELGVELTNTKSIMGKKATGRVSTRKGKKFPEAGIKLSATIAAQRKDVKEYSKKLERMSKTRKKWISDNPERQAEIIDMARRASKARSMKNMEATILSATVRTSIKRLVRLVLRKTGEGKKSRSVEMLGYTGVQLKDHIAAKFTDDMSWDNRPSFHIDHIVPIDAFVRHGVTDPRIISALVNLRPMLPVDNQRKSSAYNDDDFDNDLSNILDHISYGARMRRSILTAHFHPGSKTSYTPGLSDA